MTDKVVQFTFKSIELQNTVVRREDEQPPKLSFEVATLKGETRFDGNGNTYSFPDMATLTADEQRELNDLLKKIEAHLFADYMRAIVRAQIPK